jgi:hypothetical protein
MIYWMIGRNGNKNGRQVMIIPHEKMPTKKGRWSVSLLKL